MLQIRQMELFLKPSVLPRYSNERFHSCSQILRMQLHICCIKGCGPALREALSQDGDGYLPFQERKLQHITYFCVEPCKYCSFVVTFLPVVPV